VPVCAKKTSVALCKLKAYMCCIKYHYQATMCVVYKILSNWKSTKSKNWLRY